MEGGFASGAMARWRTLHEISVVSFFIKDHGRQLAERYLQHHAIDSYKSANRYQEYCKALGYAPFRKNELRKLKETRDALCTKYGGAFGGDWGWASPETGKQKPTFADIEEKVCLDHFRPFFKLACHSIHAGSKGLWFDMGNASGPSSQQILLAGPSSTGLYDPGVRLAVSLLQVTVNLVLCRDVTIWSLLIAETLGQLRDEIEESFARAESRIDERIRKELQRNTRKTRKKGRM